MFYLKSVPTCPRSHEGTEYSKLPGRESLSWKTLDPWLGLCWCQLWVCTEGRTPSLFPSRQSLASPTESVWLKWHSAWPLYRWLHFFFSSCFRDFTINFEGFWHLFLSYFRTVFFFCFILVYLLYRVHRGSLITRLTQKSLPYCLPWCKWGLLLQSYRQRIHTLLHSCTHCKSAQILTGLRCFTKLYYNVLRPLVLESDCNAR